MIKREFSISTAEKVYLVLGFLFAALACSEWFKKSSPSGRWGWLQALAEAYLEPNGYVKLLTITSMWWFAVFLTCVLSRIRKTKGEV